MKIKIFLFFTILLSAVIFSENIYVLYDESEKSLNELKKIINTHKIIFFSEDGEYYDNFPEQIKSAIINNDEVNFSDKFGNERKIEFISSNFIIDNNISVKKNVEKLKNRLYWEKEYENIFFEGYIDADNPVLGSKVTVKENFTGKNYEAEIVEIFDDNEGDKKKARVNFYVDIPTNLNTNFIGCGKGGLIAFEYAREYSENASEFAPINSVITISSPIGGVYYLSESFRNDAVKYFESIDYIYKYLFEYSSKEERDFFVRKILITIEKNIEKRSSEESLTNFFDISEKYMVLNMKKFIQFVNNEGNLNIEYENIESVDYFLKNTWPEFISYDTSAVDFSKYDIKSCYADVIDDLGEMYNNLGYNTYNNLMHEVLLKLKENIYGREYTLNALNKDLAKDSDYIKELDNADKYGSYMSQEVMLTKGKPVSYGSIVSQNNRIDDLFYQLRTQTVNISDNTEEFPDGKWIKFFSEYNYQFQNKYTEFSYSMENLFRDITEDNYNDHYPYKTANNLEKNYLDKKIFNFFESKNIENLIYFFGKNNIINKIEEWTKKTDGLIYSNEGSSLASKKSSIYVSSENYDKTINDIEYSNNFRLGRYYVPENDFRIIGSSEKPNEYTNKDLLKLIINALNASDIYYYSLFNN